MSGKFTFVSEENINKKFVDVKVNIFDEGD